MHAFVRFHTGVGICSIMNNKASNESQESIFHRTSWDVLGTLDNLEATITHGLPPVLSPSDTRSQAYTGAAPPHSQPSILEIPRSIYRT